jgi:hypothetical protein
MAAGDLDGDVISTSSSTGSAPAAILRNTRPLAGRRSPQREIAQYLRDRRQVRLLGSAVQVQEQE